jgi:hypothetical protein
MPAPTAMRNRRVRCLLRPHLALLRPGPQALADFERTARGTQESLRNSAYDPGAAEIVATSATMRDGSCRGRCASDEVACQPSFAASTSALTRSGGQVAAPAGNLRLAC